MCTFTNAGDVQICAMCDTEKEPKKNQPSTPGSMGGSQSTPHGKKQPVSKKSSDEEILVKKAAEDEGNHPFFIPLY